MRRRIARDGLQRASSVVSWCLASLAILAVATSTQAQPADPYLAADWPDVVIDGAIAEKAAELQNDPVLIYEYVRNEIRYASYWGLMRGPVATFKSGAGNDYDQASLLVSLMRAGGYRARFARNIIKLNCEQVSGWLGVVTVDDGQGGEDCSGGAAYLRATSAAGMDPNCVSCAEFEPQTELTTLIHVWAEVEVPLDRYRGRRLSTNTPDLGWIALDPSMVDAVWPARIPELMTAPEFSSDREFDLEGYLAELQTSLPVELYADQIQEFLNTQNVVSAKTGAGILVDELYRDGEVIPIEAGILPTALPYGIYGGVIVSRDAKLENLHSSGCCLYESGAATYRHMRSVHICNEVGATSGATIPSGDCVALDATHEDKLFHAEAPASAWEGSSLILQFLPGQALPPGGIESITSCNSSWDVTPHLYLDEVEMLPPDADGIKTSGICDKKTVVLDHQFPNGTHQRFPDDVRAGGIYALSFDASTSSEQFVREAAERLEAANEQYPIIEGPGGTAIVDDGSGLNFVAHPDAQRALVGGLLHLAGRRWSERLRTSWHQIGTLSGQLSSPFIETGVVSAGYENVTVFGQVVGAEASAWLIDIGARIVPFLDRVTGAQTPHAGQAIPEPFVYTAPDGGTGFVNTHSEILGVVQGSALEHSVWEELISAEGVSTVKGLQLGSEVYEKNQLVVTPTGTVSGPGLLSITPTEAVAAVEDIEGAPWGPTYCEIASSFPSVYASTSGLSISGLEQAQLENNRPYSQLDCSTVPSYSGANLEATCDQWLMDAGTDLLNADHLSSASPTPTGARTRASYRIETPDLAGNMNHSLLRWRIGGSVSFSNPISDAIGPTDPNYYPGPELRVRITGQGLPGLGSGDLLYDNTPQLGPTIGEVSRLFTVGPDTGGWWYPDPAYELTPAAVINGRTCTLIPAPWPVYYECEPSSPPSWPQSELLLELESVVTYRGSGMPNYTGPFTREMAADPSFADVARVRSNKMIVRWETEGDGCTQPLKAGTTNELRIMDEPYFEDHNGFQGFVYYRNATINGGLSLTMAISTDVPGATQKGAYSTGLLWNSLFTAPPPLPTFQIAPSLLFDPPTFGFANRFLSNVSVGDPVSVAGGNFFDVSTDFSIRGRGGFDLNFVRSYNSRLKFDGALGYGWIHTFDQHLRDDDGVDAGTADPQMVWVTEEATEQPWTVLGPGSFEAQASVHDVLEQRADGGYQVTTKAGMIYDFAPLSGDFAWLERITDRNGNSIQVERTEGQVSRVIDTAGRDLLFQYADGPNGSRNVTVTDFSGRIWTYHIDADGNLDEYKDAVQIAHGSDDAWRYTYYAGEPNPALDHKLKCWIKPQGGKTPAAGVEPLCGASAQGHAWMRFDYYGNGAVQRHTDALGRETRFSYDYFGKRTRVDYPDGAHEEYQFDGFANIVRLVDRRGVVTSFEFDEERREQKRAWDGHGKLNQANYDTAGNIIRKVDRVGHQENFTHNEFGQVLTRIDRLGNTSESRYDEQGNLLALRSELGGVMTEFARFDYDDYGNQISASELRLPGSQLPPATTMTTLDAGGVAPIAIREPIGQIDIVNDTLGRPIELSRRRVNDDNPQTVVTSAVDVISVYDESDRPVLIGSPAASATDSKRVWIGSVFDADGNVTTTCSWVTPNKSPPASAATPCDLPPGGLTAGYELRVDSVVTYDVMGRAVSVSDTLGNVSTSEFDGMDRVTSRRSPEGRVLRQIYDGAGNVIEAISPSGRRTRFEYDANGLLVATIDALGRRNRTVYDAEGRVLEQYAPGDRLLLRIVRDAAGNATSVFDGAGTETRTDFDELGRSKSTTRALGTSDETTQAFEYDLLGRLVSRTDGEGHTVRLSYDVSGRVVSEADEFGRTSSYVYDDMGNLSELRMPDGRPVRFEYDDRGLSTRRWGDGFDDTYVYDARGRLVLARNAEVRERWEYDALDRVVATSHNYTGTSRVIYDADGLIRNFVYPRGGTFGYPETTIARYFYDLDGDLTAVEDPIAGRWSYEKDAIGREVRRLGPDGSQRKLSYHGSGFLASVETIIGGVSVDVASYPEADYDALGNPKRIVRSGGQVTDVAYDLLSRVSSIRYPDGNVSGTCGSVDWECFEYDRTSNRTRHHTTAGTEFENVVDAADQLVAIRDVSTSQTIESFGYDVAGRRSSRSSASTTSNYRYDALGRLASVTSDSHDPTRFAYSPTGGIFRRSDGTTAHDYVFGDGVEHRNGTRVRSVLAGLGGRSIAEVVGNQGATPAVRERFSDGRGNLSHVSEAGSLVWFAKYKGFGSVASEIGVNPTQSGFSGARIEGPTGLLRMGARHYDPTTGRFLQSDPLGVRADQPYAYAANNPYVFSDPSGLSPFVNSSADRQLNLIGINSSPGRGGQGAYSSQGVGAGQGVAKYVGLQSALAGDVRASYATQAAALDPFDKAGRSALKLDTRARTPRLFNDVIEYFRPGVGPRPGSVGRAAVSNAGADLVGGVLRVGGRAVVGASLLIDAGRIYISSDRARTTVQVGFGIVGALGGGTLGVLGGSAVAPGPGTVIGGIGGAATGGAGGEYVGGQVYDYFFR